MASPVKTHRTRGISDLFAGVVFDNGTKDRNGTAWAHHMALMTTYMTTTSIISYFVVSMYLLILKIIHYFPLMLGQWISSNMWFFSSTGSLACSAHRALPLLQGRIGRHRSEANLIRQAVSDCTFSQQSGKCGKNYRCSVCLYRA